MNDFFNVLGNNLYDKLCDIDQSLHRSGKENSSIDNFIHELKKYLFLSDAKYKLQQIPKDSVLEVNEIENTYVQCYLNHEDYLIPYEMIDKTGLKSQNIGFIGLQLKNDGLYHVVDL